MTRRFSIILICGIIGFLGLGLIEIKADDKESEKEGGDGGSSNWNGFTEMDYTGSNLQSSLASQKIQRQPMGIIGAYGKVEVGKNNWVIDEVVPGCPAAKAGLKVGDIVTGFNGSAIPGALVANECDPVIGPKEALGYSIEESLKQKKPILKMSVLRDGQNINLDVILPPLGAFGEDYPFNCKRSEKMLNDIVERIVKVKGDKMNFGGYVTTATAGLAVLGSGNLKMSSHCRDFARYCATCDTSDKVSTWFISYACLYLCEYYLATGEKEFLPIIETQIRQLEKRTNENGRHGHGFEVGYNGFGLNIVSTIIFMDFALAQKCGIEVNKEKKLKLWEHLKQSTGNNGECAYGVNAQGNGSWGISGQFVCALHNFKGDKDMDAAEIENYIQKTTTWLIEQRAGCRNAHACGTFGMSFSTSALAATRHSKKDKGFRTHMDYWIWYMNMGQRPVGSPLDCYFLCSNGNNGGDYYLGFNLIAHASRGIMLASGKKYLFINGNETKFWFNKTELLRRAGILPKVISFQKEILALEKKKQYKEAYAVLLKLKTLDPDNDMLFEKVRDWRNLANTEINKVLPYLADKDYYIVGTKLKNILAQYGEEIIPRAQMFLEKIKNAPIASEQLKDGVRSMKLVAKYKNKELSAEQAAQQIKEIANKYSGTSFQQNGITLSERILEDALTQK